jgi:uncharacterized protein YegP (UPF0339 family)
MSGFLSRGELRRSSYVEESAAAATGTSHQAAEPAKEIAEAESSVAENQQEEMSLAGRRSEVHDSVVSIHCQKGCTMPAKFQVKKARNGKFYFNYLAANGEIVLTSQMYASKATAKKGIASVQNNATDMDQIEANTNKKGEHYFVLKAKNQQVIGTSEGYAGRTGMKNGMKSVSKNAPKAVTEDITVKVTG